MPGSWDGMGDRSTPHKDHRCAHRSLPSAPGTFPPWEPLPRHQAAGAFMFCCLSFSWLVRDVSLGQGKDPREGALLPSFCPSSLSQTLPGRVVTTPPRSAVEVGKKCRRESRRAAGEFGGGDRVKISLFLVGGVRVCQILEMSLRKQEDFLRGKLWRCCRIEEIQLVQKISKVAESENTRIRVGERQCG